MSDYFFDGQIPSYRSSDLTKSDKIDPDNNSIIINTLKFNDIHYDKFRYRKLDFFVLRFFPESTKIDGSGSSSSSVDPIGLSSGNGPSC